MRHAARAILMVGALALGACRPRPSTSPASATTRVPPRPPAFARVEPMSDEEAAWLARELRDADPVISVEAATTLATKGPRGHDILTAGLHRLTGVARRRVGLALLPDVERMREGPGVSPEYRARRALCPELLPIAREAARDGDDGDRMRAFIGLAECGDASDVPLLRDVIANSAMASVRVAAVESLARMSGDRNMSDAVVALTSALNDPDPGVARVAAGALARSNAPARAAALPLLVSLLEGSDFDRSWAARDLARMGGPAVGPVAAILADPARRRDLRLTAARILGEDGIRWGDAAPKAAQCLTATLRDSDRSVAIAAALALIRYPGPHDALRTLVTATSDDDARVRVEALRGLLWAGYPDDQALGGAVFALFSEDEQELRGRVADALCHLGDDAVPCVDALRALLDDAHEPSRRWSKDVLALMAEGCPSEQRQDAVGNLQIAAASALVSARRRAR